MTPTTDYWTTAHQVLTDKQLRILELREIHGFSLRTIALTCQVSVSTVRSTIDDARHKITLALKEPA